MNRPDFEDYKWKYKTQWNYDIARYIKNIEEYCDYIEKYKDKQFNAGFNEATKICSEKIIALENALDKACEDIATYVIKDVDKCEIVYMQLQILKEKYKSEYLSESEKEWLSKDE